MPSFPKIAIWYLAATFALLSMLALIAPHHGARALPASEQSYRVGIGR